MAQFDALLSELDSILDAARRAPTTKHAFALLAVRVEDAVYRYRYQEITEATQIEQESDTLRRYLEGR